MAELTVSHRIVDDVRANCNTPSTTSTIASAPPARLSDQPYRPGGRPSLVSFLASSNVGARGLIQRHGRALSTEMTSMPAPGRGCLTLKRHPRSLNVKRQAYFRGGTRRLT